MKKKVLRFPHQTRPDNMLFISFQCRCQELAADFIEMGPFWGVTIDFRSLDQFSAVVSFVKRQVAIFAVCSWWINTLTCCVTDDLTVCLLLRWRYIPVLNDSLYVIYIHTQNQLIASFLRQACACWVMNIKEKNNMQMNGQWCEWSATGKNGTAVLTTLVVTAPVVTFKTWLTPIWAFQADLSQSQSCNQKPRFLTDTFHFLQLPR